MTGKLTEREKEQDELKVEWIGRLDFKILTMHRGNRKFADMLASFYDEAFINGRNSITTKSSFKHGSRRKNGTKKRTFQSL